MAEKKMPAAEAAEVGADNERISYEAAFHVLPTVAEGEVSSVFEDLKAHITKAGGELFDEEAPQRIDLAYDIEQHVEGKNRRFHSAYFGWVRFRIEGGKLPGLTEEIEGMPEVLRTLVLKLTKLEEANPFRYHEAVREEKKVRVVEDKEILTEAATEDTSIKVSEEALDESLDRITEDTDVAEAKEEAKADTEEAK
jgi:ribosomal protein S6